MSCKLHGTENWKPGCRECLKTSLRLSSDPQVNGNRLYQFMRLNGHLNKVRPKPEPKPTRHDRKVVARKSQYELPT